METNFDPKKFVASSQMMRQGLESMIAQMEEAKSLLGENSKLSPEEKERLKKELDKLADAKAKYQDAISKIK